MSATQPLTDALVEAALARLAGRASDAGLHEAIMGGVARTSQVGRPPFRTPELPALLARSRVRWAAVLAAALLLVALLGTAILVGGWLPNRVVVIAPSPTPARTVTADATILATTNAKPLPAQAACPPGSNPDAPGPADQTRPAVGYFDFGPEGSMAYDRHVGRIVLLARDERDPYQRTTTWTYDVCTNTWQRMSTADRLPALGRLVYDADSDRTVAFLNAYGVPGGTSEIWSYDSTADRWAMVGSLPYAPGGADGTYGTIFYHDPSGLIVLYDRATMWAYDVDTNTFAEIRQRPDPAQPAGSGLPQGMIAFGYDPARDLVVAVVAAPPDTEGYGYGVPPSPQAETWTFDPATGAWRKETAVAASDLVVCAFLSSYDCWSTNGRAVYDEASGLVVFLNRDNQGGVRVTPTDRGRVDAFDTGQRAWRTLYDPPPQSVGGPPIWCTSAPPVYDPINRRIVCLAGDLSIVRPEGAPAPNGVSAFSTGTGGWRWVLEPTATLPPTPTLAPGATPIDWGTPPPW